MFSFYVLTLLLSCGVLTQGFTSTSRSKRSAARVQPLSESFGFDFAEDQVENTDPIIIGEVNYKNFVESYKPNALLLGNYNIVEKIREAQLLSLTVDSGLLEALEAKGITLSQIEKLLPLVDDLGLLTLVKNNKQLLINLAPLIIEPAPLLLPLVASVLNTPAATFQFPGLALLAAGGFEITQGSTVPGALLVLLGIPLAGLGTLLGSLGGLSSLPSATSYSTSTVNFRAPSAKGPKARKEKRAQSTRVTSKAEGGAQNGKRKLVKINKR